jgi:membrane fusion protein (multidrug efflux system)
MATMMPPSIVLVVQDQAQLELKFRLPERALAALKEGAVVKARFDALGVSRDATVSRINPTVDPQTRTIELVAVIDNADGALRPGLLAEVDLPGGAR